MHLVKGHLFRARNGQITWRRSHYRGQGTSKVSARDPQASSTAIEDTKFTTPKLHFYPLPAFTEKENSMTFGEKNERYLTAKKRFSYLDKYSGEWWSAVMRTSELRMIELLEIQESEWWARREDVGLDGSKIDIDAIIRAELYNDDSPLRDRNIQGLSGATPKRGPVTIEYCENCGKDTPHTLVTENDREFLKCEICGLQCDHDCPEAPPTSTM